MPQDLHTDTDMYWDLLLMVARNVMTFSNSRKVFVTDCVVKDWYIFVLYVHIFKIFSFFLMINAIISYNAITMQFLCCYDIKSIWVWLWALFVVIYFCFVLKQMFLSLFKLQNMRKKFYFEQKIVSTYFFLLLG